MERADELDIEIIEKLKADSVKFVQDIVGETYTKHGETYVTDEGPDKIEIFDENEQILAFYDRIGELSEKVFKHDGTKWNGSMPHIKCNNFPVHESSKEFGGNEYLEVYSA